MFYCIGLLLRGRCFSLLIIVLVIGLVGGCDADTSRLFQAMLSDAEGQISRLNASEDAGIINGNLDYGWKVSFSVKNLGQDGIIIISPWFSSSEGEWSRVQKISFRAGESKNFSYFFHEPTVNATNGQYGVKVNP